MDFLLTMCPWPTCGYSNLTDPIPHTVLVASVWRTNINGGSPYKMCLCKTLKFGWRVRLTFVWSIVVWVAATAAEANVRIQTFCTASFAWKAGRVACHVVILPRRTGWTWNLVDLNVAASIHCDVRRREVNCKLLLWNKLRSSWGHCDHAIQL